MGVEVSSIGPCQCCGVIKPCCPDVALPNVLTVTHTGGTGDCACLNGATYQLTYNSVSGKWDATVTLCDRTVFAEFYCQGGTIWVLAFDTQAGGAQSAASCDPFFWTSGIAPGLLCPFNAGSATVTA